MITALAAEYPEFREAMAKDATLGFTFGGYVSSPADKTVNLQAYRDTPSHKRIVSSSNDTRHNSTHTEIMNDITREELNAKLEAVEARMDGRVASIEGKIDAFLAAQAERDKASEYRFGRIESDVAEIKQSLSKSFSSLKSTMVVTAVSTVLAIVIGIAGFNAMLTSNMLAAFQAGKGERVEAPVIQSSPPASTSGQNKPRT
ncbi:hypothetical protein [Stutzerimonas stutzeri]|uniref:hypothetical protein n=1 Tax=Stutzerimonas stutzeri TaxID=316 RepID=UPI00265AFB98|nr:hypothetical protein [Stutzerimonas stutzeri]MCF6780888.1 hypothetical protein [Stutzerimonas stutzeri]MCF6803458.1 hypothetical protein [Stutzerimonas stutzeri]